MTEQLETKLYYIYKIVCKDLNNKSVYVGSTVDFYNRSAKHKSHCHNEKSEKYNGRLYRTIRENGGWNKWEMLIIHTEIYTNKQNKLIKERKYIDSLSSDLNTKKPYVTTEEIKKTCANYYISNKETISKVQKDYYNNNKEKLSKASKDRYKKARLQKVTCECGHVYCLPDRTQHIKTKYHQKHINTTILCKTEIE